MSKIIILVGGTGSGKTTLARRLRETSEKQAVIVSRDSIRKALYGLNDKDLQEEYYKRQDLYSLEKNVTVTFHEMVLNHLSRGMDVIADNTHLKLEFIEDYVKYNVPTELVVVHTPLEICLEQNAKKQFPLPAEEVKKQYQQLRSLLSVLNIKYFTTGLTLRFPSYNFKTKLNKKADYDKSKEDCIVVDIDGTIADHKNKRSPFDWASVGQDFVKEDVANLVRKLARNSKIIMCTGRDAEASLTTQMWLEEHGIPYDAILTRQKGDTRADYAIKEELWKQIEQHYNITMMIDDRRQVIDHARALGYTVADVANHTF